MQPDRIAELVRLLAEAQAVAAKIARSSSRGQDESFTVCREVAQSLAWSLGAAAATLACNTFPRPTYWN